MRFDALLTVRCDVLEMSSLLLSLIRSYTAFWDRCWLAARPPTWSVGAIVWMPTTRRPRHPPKHRRRQVLRRCTARKLVLRRAFCREPRFCSKPSPG